MWFDRSTAERGVPKHEYPWLDQRRNECLPTAQIAKESTVRRKQYKWTPMHITSKQRTVVEPQAGM